MSEGSRDLPIDLWLVVSEILQARNVDRLRDLQWQHVSRHTLADCLQSDIVQRVIVLGGQLDLSTKRCGGCRATFLTLLEMWHELLLNLNATSSTVVLQRFLLKPLFG